MHRSDSSETEFSGNLLSDPTAGLTEKLATAKIVVEENLTALSQELLIPPESNSTENWPMSMSSRLFHLGLILYTL